MRKFLSLKWLHPHSLSGIMVFFLGLSITASSIFGSFYLVNSNFLHIYLLATVLNSIFGASILQGPPDVQLGFKYGILLQLCLCYICFRLRPAQLHFSWNFLPLAFFDKALGRAPALKQFKLVLPSKIKPFPLASFWCLWHTIKLYYFKLSTRRLF